MLPPNQPDHPDGPAFPVTLEGLAAWRERLHAAMLAHPQHHLDWRLRQAFYLALGGESPAARAFRGWLAVLCAQRVLPLAFQVLPHESLPFRLISAALALLRGLPTAEDVNRLQDEAYHFIHHDGLDGRWHWVADRAVFTGYKALLEVQGWPDPFTSLGPQWTTTLETDIQSAGSADAASSAAVAWAGQQQDERFQRHERHEQSDQPEGLYLNPEHLKDFWEWWLNDAWQAALKLAARYP